MGFKVNREWRGQEQYGVRWSEAAEATGQCTQVSDRLWPRGKGGRTHPESGASDMSGFSSSNKIKIWRVDYKRNSHSTWQI